MNPIKIISGGQCGVDVAALRAAKALGFPTGGTMPKGFRTLDGPRPEYAAMYGMVANASSGYLWRTRCNVRDGDATIRIAANLNSAGEQATIRAIRDYLKPYADVHVRDVSSFTSLAGQSPDHIAKWITANNVRILNVAGNSEHTAPGIEVWAERYVTAVLKLLA